MLQHLCSYSHFSTKITIRNERGLSGPRDVVADFEMVLEGRGTNLSCALSASISFSILSISDFKWIFRLLICAYSSISTPLACQQVPNSLSCEPWPAHTALLWLVLKPAQSCLQDLLLLEGCEFALSYLEAAWRWRSGSAFVDGMRSRHRWWWGCARPCLRFDWDGANP